MEEGLTVESVDVIRLILQFLHENGLWRSFYCLQEESNTTLDSVDALATVEADVLNGRWDAVLKTIGTVTLPDELLFKIYEHVVCELVELEEYNVAQLLLRETAALQAMKLAEPQRFTRLNKLSTPPARVGPPQYTARDLYKGSSKKVIRGNLAKQLLPHFSQAPPSSLLTLLGLSLRWKQEQGLIPTTTKSYDLFRGVARTDVAEGSSEDNVVDSPSPINNIVRTIQVGGPTSPPQACAWADGGRRLIVSSRDGLIEVYDWLLGKLAIDLNYQKEGLFMLHEISVRALATSSDGLLASGCAAGEIKIWKLSSGQCVRLYTAAHTKEITSLQFNKDITHLLSSSLDGSVRLFGLNSGKMLRLFRADDSFVAAAVISEDGKKVIAGTAAGLIFIWDYRTADRITSFSPPAPAGLSEGSEIPITFLFNVPKDFLGAPSNSFFVGTRSNSAYLMTPEGAVVRTYTTGKQEAGELCGGCISAGGRWLYVVDAGHRLYAFDSQSASLQSSKKLHQSDITCVAHHPSQNVLATCSHDGNVHVLQT